MIYFSTFFESSYFDLVNVPARTETFIVMSDSNLSYVVSDVVKLFIIKFLAILFSKKRFT